MQLIYSKDETAPDAVGAAAWLQNHLGVKDLHFEVIYQSPVSFQIHKDDGDTRLFEHNGVFYVLQFSCGKYEEVFTATADEVSQLLNQYRDTLTKPSVAKVKHKAVRTFDVQYFKTTGKCHTESRFDLEVKLLENGEPYMEEAYSHVRQLQQAGTLPGLSPGCGKEYTILVSHPDGSCRLLPALN